MFLTLPFPLGHLLPSFPLFHEKEVKNLAKGQGRLDKEMSESLQQRRSQSTDLKYQQSPTMVSLPLHTGFTGLEWPGVWEASDLDDTIRMLDINNGDTPENSVGSVNILLDDDSVDSVQSHPVARAAEIHRKVSIEGLPAEKGAVQKWSSLDLDEDEEEEYENYEEDYLSEYEFHFDLLSRNLEQTEKYFFESINKMKK